MIKNKFIGIYGAITEGPVTDCLGFDVECFYASIIDRHLKIVEVIFW